MLGWPHIHQGCRSLKGATSSQRGCQAQQHTVYRSVELGTPSARKRAQDRQKPMSAMQLSLTGMVHTTFAACRHEGKCFVNRKRTLRSFSPPGKREALDLCELMKLDVANHQIRTFRVRFVLT